MARRRRIEEHDNLDRWLVSYADFITLLFAFFVVMYALSTINEGKYRLLSESLEEAFQHEPAAVKFEDNVPTGKPVPVPIKIPTPAMPPPHAKETEAMKNMATDILKVMGPLVRDGQVTVTQSDRGIAVEINASLLFPSGAATLEPQSIATLQAVARVLAGAANPIQVEGYTDNTPISTTQFPSNWELSAARASSVVRLFVDNGITPDRLLAIGYADNSPIASNDTPEGRARNRRVTIMILARPQQTISQTPVANGPKP